MNDILEKMGDFFDARLDIYDEHQLTCIQGADAFLAFTADRLPKGACDVLDLGCGTGLELGYYYAVNPAARVTGIDVAPGMMRRLKEKFSDKEPTLLLGSYFDLPFGTETFDAAVSVESLHHFTAEEKRPLYRKLRAALRNGGYFVLTDYFAIDEAQETALRKEYHRLRAEQHLPDGEFYHFDTPLTVEHETACLKSAGFANVTTLASWGQTSVLLAKK